MELAGEALVHELKKRRLVKERSDPFDGLPDDLLISILARLSSSARSPSDFISVLLTCTRLNRLGLNPTVLQKAGPNTLAVRAKNWSDSAHRFLKACVNSGNLEASYILGMIRFYCLYNRGGGAAFMAKAAIKGHKPALHSLAVIQFNRSGGHKNSKDLFAAVALCSRAAHLGHIDSIRELGHCYLDGYGVKKNDAEGRRLLLEANARELADFIRSSANHHTFRSVRDTIRNHPGYKSGRVGGCTEAELWSELGWPVYPREMHPANRFLSEWFELKDSGRVGLRRCSDSNCGRPEARMSEFRRCSSCGKVNYCSRGCQAYDWKVRHKTECIPLPEREDDADADAAADMDGRDGDDNDQTVEVGDENNVA